MPVNAFHPAVLNWFNQTFTVPTQAQLEAWPVIKSGQHTLIAAPTGSGKTLAAFLAAIDDLVWQGLSHDLFGQLNDQVQILYVSPLKALSNDIQKNLEMPLAGIRAELREQGWGEINIRTMVRTGDTPSGERERMRRKPPHILVTTPESLYILLTSDSGRRALAMVRTLIIDEIHALAGNKRGAHLALSIERLQALCSEPLTRVGLSATQKPLHTMAQFLTGQARPNCTVIDVGYQQERDLAIEVTLLPLEAVLSAEGWEQIYMALCDLIQAHRITLIFVNTRRQAERIAKALSERLGDQAVGSHHGSLAREHRLAMEQRLKAGQLQALVATASLELGIDIGDVDLVCQIGSPRALNTFLQRVGRSGHAVHGIPKGRLFPTSLDDLVECMALLQAIREGELDRLNITQGALDVLAQQLLAEVSCREWQVDDLFALTHRAWPYRGLARDDFDAVVAMLAEGFATRRGRRSAWLHYDAVNGLLRARRGAKLAAVLNAGVIPDLFDYDVILQPESLFIGTLNEDFAFESLPGDIFQLGNISYRILKIERSRVLVEDAHGQPPNIPFWFGEAPGRTDELSLAVSKLRNAVDARLGESGSDAAADWLSVQTGASSGAVRQAIDYLAAAHAALGRIPTQENVAFERFFDEAGDQHLVVHAPFGSRLNRAWGLALRKRFCRKFNFELQAAALEDTIVLSLGSTHSFPLDEVANYLKSATVRDVLTQALLDAPMFATHWRWNATVALAVRRNRNGKRVAPQLQRMDAEDLLALIFPDQLACLENVVGNRVIPDHPLVQQTVEDCLNTVMDIRGLEALLRRIEAGNVKLMAMDLVGPSPLAQGILSARPYAFLDNAPAEERRTQMVQARNFLTPQDSAELGRLDPEAIARVRAEAWPEARNADELHDALMLLGFITEQEARLHFPEHGRAWLERLSHDRRACVLTPSTNDLMNRAQLGSPEVESSGVDHSSGIDRSRSIWVCAERLYLLQVLYPQASLNPEIRPVGEVPAYTREAALVALLRSRLEGLGPVSTAMLADSLGVAADEILVALTALETEGSVMRGRFTPEAQHTEWCERGLLARIHRYTLGRLRQQIQPASPADFMRFLLQWHGLDGGDASGSAMDQAEGMEATARAIRQLEGFEIPSVAWEESVLAVRIRDYRTQWLDQLCAAGRVLWVRLTPPASLSALNELPIVSPRPVAAFTELTRIKKRRASSPLRTTPLALLNREELTHWCDQPIDPNDGLSSSGCRILESLDRRGASFFDELLQDSGLLPSQVEAALAELAAWGLVSSDSFVGLRALISPVRRHKRHHNLTTAAGVANAGRWFRVRRPSITSQSTGMEVEICAVEHRAQVMLRRYGVVFRSLLNRETGSPPWRELLPLYRRWEARGEVRGGRFVEGMAGEQFALPEAVGLLRDVSKQAKDGRLVAISASDPLNLVGIVLPGQRIPALAGNRVVYRDGALLARWIGGKLLPAEMLSGELALAVRNLLFRRKPMGKRSSTDGLRRRSSAVSRLYRY